MKTSIRARFAALQLALRGYSCASRTRFARFARARRAFSERRERAKRSARQNFCGVAKKPCSDFHADRSKTVAAKARGALFLRGVSERSERQNFLIAYNLPRTAKNTCAKNHDDRSNDATRRGKHTNTQTNRCPFII